jgi:hypothetical protein
VLLGAFVVWQLVFIVASNLFDLFPHRIHRLDEMTSFRELLAGTKNPRPVIHALASVTDCWAQLTGQYQMWWLFAPDFPQQATFPVVELRWDDAALPPIRLLSPTEPANTASYFHPPDSTDRLLHYEVNLGLGYAYFDQAEAAEAPDKWRRRHFDMVSSQWKSMRAYMQWKTTRFLAQRPDLPPPDEVRLLIRLYPSPPPGAVPAQRSPPYDLPYSRWRCAEQGSSDFLPVEAYDLFTERYVALPYPPGTQKPIKVAQRP